MSLKENKMGVMPVGRLLLGMALPMALSMLVQALYNVVDSMFVSRISDLNNDALNAVSLAFPVQNIMIGIATGVAVGVNALLSRGLGEKNMKEVNSSALNGLFLAMCGSLLCMLFGIFGAEPYMRSLTQVEATIQYGIQYIRVICIVSFGIFGEILFERLLQSTGRTAYTLVTQGTGAIINIILDPILIFGYFGLPRMEVMGAAVATVIGQIVAFLLAVILNRKKNLEVKLNLRRFRPDRNMIGRILAIGVPSIIMIAIGSIMTYCFNRVLGRFNAVSEGLGEAGISVFGAYFKLQSFVFMPVFGINNAVLAISAFNYGARKPERITAVLRWGITYSCTLMAIGMTVFQLIPETLLGIFQSRPAHADRRHSRASDSVPAVHSGGHEHHVQRRIPGTRPQHFQHDRVHLAPASGADSGGVSAVAERQHRRGLALLPNCRGRVAVDYGCADAFALPQKNPPVGTADA